MAPFAAKGKRRRMFYDAFCRHRFFYVLTRCSAMAGQIVTKSSPTDVFAVLFINSDTPMTVGSPKNLGPKTSTFWSKHSDSTIFGWLLRGNDEEFGKTKTTSYRLIHVW